MTEKASRGGWKSILISFDALKQQLRCNHEVMLPSQAAILLLIQQVFEYRQNNALLC